MSEAVAVARFAGWKPKPGEIAIRYAGAFEIEIFQSRPGMWAARTRETRGVHADTETTSVDGAQKRIIERFVEQQTAWRWIDTAGNPTVPADQDAAVMHGTAERKPAGVTLPKRMAYTLCQLTALTVRMALDNSKVTCPQCRERIAALPQPAGAA